jgi:hypothetical protein
MSTTRRFFRLPSGTAGLAALITLAVPLLGCGTTKGRLATEQLVMSDAVDRAVSEIDFRPLSGRKVFLDTKYVQNTKALVFVNADYVVSSVRQQMLAADCRLTDTAEAAEVIAEIRIGTLGTDSNEVVYGMPASNMVSNAANLVPNAPVVPPIPEISLARKEAQMGAAKLALFAYDRETRKPIWQSGISRAKSTAQDMWVFGAGPFQKGSSVQGMQFAGTKLSLPSLRDDGAFDEGTPVAYDAEHLFSPPSGGIEPGEVQVAGFVSHIDGASQQPAPGKTTDAVPPPADAGKAAEAPAEKKSAEPQNKSGASAEGDVAPASGGNENESGAQARVTDQGK